MIFVKSPAQITEHLISYFLSIAAVDLLEISDIRHYQMEVLLRFQTYQCFRMVEKCLSGVQPGQLIMLHSSQCLCRFFQLDHTVDPADDHSGIIGLRNEVRCSQIQALYLHILLIASGSHDHRY